MEDDGRGHAPGADSLLACTVLCALLALSWAVVLMPRIGGGILAVAAVFGVCVLIATSVAVRSRVKHPGQTLGWRLAWPVALATALGSGTLLLSALRADGMPSWVMREDMVWNTVQSLLLNADGGVRADLHPNPAPLTNALFAIAYGIDPSLSTVFRVHAVLILILVTLLSLLSGLYAVRRTAHLHLVVRAGIAFGVAWLPYTALGLGAVMEHGHANALTSMVILWAGWIVYCESGFNRRLRAALLLAAATALLASWAPLAAIPAALALGLAFEGRRDWRAVWVEQPRSLVLPGLALLQFVAYAALVTLPDLRREGGALAADGGIGSLTPSVVVVLLLVFSLIAMLTLQTRHPGSALWRPGFGVLVVLAASVPVLGYLFWQRMGLESLWGYYPVKYLNLLVFLLVGVSMVSIATLIRPAWRAARQLVAAAFALPLALLVVWSASQGSIGAVALAPGMAAAVAAPSQDFMQAVRDLATIRDADRNGLTVALHWSEENDSLMNGFLIQLATESGDDPIRFYAYFLDIEDPGQVCDLITLADRSVTVYTRLGEGEFSARYLDGCDAASAVTVRTELPGSST